MSCFEVPRKRRYRFWETPFSRSTTFATKSPGQRTVDCRLGLLVARPALFGFLAAGGSTLLLARSGLLLLLAGVPLPGGLRCLVLALGRSPAGLVRRLLPGALVLPRCAGPLCLALRVGSLALPLVLIRLLTLPLHA